MKSIKFILLILLNLIFWVDGAVALALLYQGRYEMSLIVGAPFLGYSLAWGPLLWDIGKELLLEIREKASKYQY